MRLFALAALLFPLTSHALPSWVANYPAPACTSTIGPGAGTLIETAVEAASGGAVICLRDGTYTGGFEIGEARPTSRVIIRSLNSLGANVDIDAVYRSTNLMFLNITFRGFSLNDFASTPHNSNISIIGNLFEDAFLIDLGGNNANTNILIYGNEINAAYTSAGQEGTLAISCQPGCSGAADAGLRIEHNLFEGTGSCADAIQTSGGVAGITIGPGNVFQNWVQGACGPHVDSHQLFDTENVTVKGNYFDNNTINSGIYDGGADFEYLHNIWHGQNSGAQSFQIGGVQGMTFSHNTFFGNTGNGNIICSFGTKAANSPNSGWVIENNVFVDTDCSTAASDQDDGCGSGCVFRYNVIDSDSSFSIVTSPTNTVSSSPTFTGGSTPSTVAGFALSGGSAGENAGNDGKDMGALYRRPPAPANFTAP